MEENKNLQNEEKKPTYEELKYYCDQLLMQRNKMGERLRQVTDILNMLPYLFEVVKNKESFNKDFVDLCIKEIEVIMTPPKEEDKKEETEKK